nr:ABC transporter substrate-binding protein [Jiangella endophytica]
MRTASRPIASLGWRTVVSAGACSSPARIPSNPVTRRRRAPHTRRCPAAPRPELAQWRGRRMPPAKVLPTRFDQLYLTKFYRGGTAMSSPSHPGSVWLRGARIAAAALAGTLALSSCGGDDQPTEQSGGSGGTSATLGFSGWSIAYLPTAIAIDRLAEQGFEVEAVALGGNPNQLQAFAQGEVDIAAIAQVMDLMDQGLPAKFFLAGNTNEFVMVSRAEFPDCESLDGKVVGIQSEASFVGQLAVQWFANECPAAAPQITVVEGSENRLAALLQGQMDASPIDLQDWTLLNAERPGEFVIVEDFTTTLPIMRGAFAATPEWLEANPELATAWVATHLEVYRDVYADPSILVDKAAELLPEVDPDLLPAVVDAFVSAESWPVDGGLGEDDVQSTIDFFDADGEAYTSVTPEGAVDLTYLDAANQAQG